MAQPGVTPLATDANGAGSADIAPNKLNLKYRIYQLTVDADGAVLQVWLTHNGIPCTSAITGITPLTASGDPYIDVGGHETLTVNVAAGPPSAALTVSYYYDELPV